MLDDNRSTSGERGRRCPLCWVIMILTLSTPSTAANVVFVIHWPETTEIGMFLTAVGLLFTLLGVLLFFDRGFLAIGNVRLIVQCIGYNSNLSNNRLLHCLQVAC